MSRTPSHPHDPDEPYQPDPEIAEILAEQNGGARVMDQIFTGREQGYKANNEGYRRGGLSQGRKAEEPFKEGTEQIMFDLFGPEIMKAVHRTMGEVRGGRKKK